jgi:SpoVK/Ycf46/Vps4 family AAA+-type ATPase
MQLSLKKQSLFLFFVTSLSISTFSVKANDREDTPSFSQEELQAFLEPTLRLLEGHLGRLEKYAQEIVLEMNNGLKVPQETPLREALLHCRQLISKYHHRARGMTVINLSELMHLSSFIEQMTSCLLSSVKSYFKKLPVFDETQVRSILPDDLTIMEVHSSANNNEQQVKRLQDKITNLRLSLTNRFFRTTFKIGSKVWPLVKYGGSATIVGAILLCQCTDWELPILRNFKLSFLNNIPVLKNFEWIQYLAARPIFGYSEHKHARILAKADVQGDFTWFSAKGYDGKELIGKPGVQKEILAKLLPLGMTNDVSNMVHDYKNDIAVQFAAGALSLSALTTDIWNSSKKIAHESWTRLSNSLQGYDIELQGEYELTSDKTFDDVIGYEEVKQQLRLHILRFLEDPERFTRLGLAPEKGWLFTGPSRTGKSFMIKALYGEVYNLMKALGKEKDFAFKHYHSSVIIKYGIKIITEILQEASPCTIIFIDEIDLLNLQRVGNSPLLANFLTTMSGFMEDKPDRQVFIIGATNKPETIDKSLRQHGRFGKEIRFDKPNFVERRIYLLKRFDELAIDITKLDVDRLADHTDGCVFEELESMMREAIHWAQAKGLPYTQELFEGALNSAVRNIVMDKPITLAPQEHLLIAVHQMGTALSRILLGSREHVSLVTTRPIVATLKEEMHYQEFYKSDEHKQKETIYGKVFTFRVEDSAGIETMQDKITMCKTLLAGYVAEEVMFGASSYSYQPENKFKAFKIAKELACKGIAQSQLSDELNAKITQTAWNMLEEYEQELKKMFEEYKPYLTLLSSWVIEQNVSGDQIVHVLNTDKSEIEEILRQATEQAEQLLDQKK